MLLSIVLFAVTFAGAVTMDERYEDLVQRYEDLVHSSMQSVVALHEVVSNIGVQVSQLSTSLLDTRLSLQKTEDLVRLLAKRIDDEEIERKKFIKYSKQEIEEVANLTSTEHLALAKRIDDEEIERKKSVKSLKHEIEEVANLTLSLEVAIKEGEIMVVSGEQSTGVETCMKVCAGTTGRSTTTWTYYSSDGIYEDVDISDCGFTTIPTVTTSIEGSGSHWTVRGTSSIYHVTTKSFRIYLNSGNTNRADQKQWNVEWIAVGYTC